VAWFHTEVIDPPVEMDGVTNGRLLIIAWASIHVIKLTGIHVALQCLLSGGWVTTLSDSPERRHLTEHVNDSFFVVDCHNVGAVSVTIPK
jgi:hypothetical protein